ncbi:hypothetical protein Fmac_013467 [Flemingia macrophylla]|uniref:Uncharacterized protein n=1 Tax=Flemingia macrophylla TaxID=520843 RepID=A0ABD1MT81_9FABA
MEGMKGGGAVAEEQEMGDGMQCSDHPFRSNPGGICAFCLQEKLGKLVSSNFPLPIRAPSSSSSSPSFRSDAAPSSSSSAATTRPSAPPNSHSHYHLPFLLPNKPTSHITLNRSKSTATPRKRNGFWSFLHLSSKKLNSKSFSHSANLKDNSSSLKSDILLHSNDTTPAANTNTPASSFDRKVSRSRSVGCGSRSFSGDFFERISTGFGDCTLRRVESQREGKPKVAAVARAADHHHHHHHCMKERVRCGGLFSGFMLTSSSSSSSSSSYWVSSSADDAVSGKSATVGLSHSRGRSWGWAFASPIRAFSGKPSSSKETNRRDIIRDANDNKNAAPNLSAIPSLLAVRG